MRHSRWYYAAAWICLISLVFQCGCAPSIGYAPSIPLLPTESREKLGTIGFVSAKCPPKITVQVPPAGRVSSAGRGAARGAVTGMVAPLRVLGTPGLNCGGSFCGLFLLLLAAASVAGGTVGGIVGGISGAVEAKPVAEAAEVKETEQKVQNALANLKMQETLKNQLFLVAQQRTKFCFVNMSGQGPATHEERANYSEFKNKGINSVLETDVVNFGLEGKPATDPSWHFFLDTRVRLVSVSDSKELYNHIFRYTSIFGKTFSEWCEVGPKLFTIYLNIAYENLSEQIVNYLFLPPTGVDFEKNKSVEIID